MILMQCRVLSDLTQRYSVIAIINKRIRIFDWADSGRKSMLRA